MLFRYPGGKNKLSDPILYKLKSLYNDNLEYREPFFGSGSIGISILNYKTIPFKNIWINDYDNGISALWTSVIKHPVELRDMIQEFKPSVDIFYEFKNDLLNKSTKNILELGFKKLVIHQLSYSGLGTKSGGPLGGKNQLSKYNIGCRWSINNLFKNINKIHKLLLSVNIYNNSCTNYDFCELIKNEKTKALIYLDPPYFYKGNELYQFGFSLNDHERLALALKNTNHKWLLSYDDCSEIRKLYDWAKIETLSIKYSISGATIKNELLISK